MKFYPYERVGGSQEVLAMLKGRHSFEIVLTPELKVLAILMGGAKSFHLLKGWGGRRLEGGGHIKFRTRYFPIL